MNSNSLLLGTRKGLLLVEKRQGCWAVTSESFSGIHVSIADVDRRTGTLFVLIDSGHFGSKTHRLRNFLVDQVPHPPADLQEACDTIAEPKYPAGATLQNGNDAVLGYQWAFASANSDQPGRIFIGTEPGGLFVSDDSGDNFRLVETLWNHSSRTKSAPGWMGGGLDNAGIHSVCIDPTNSQSIYVGVSCAGVFHSANGGETWEVRNKGLRADFLPDPNSEIGHDPHLLVQCQSAPEVLWQQNHCGIFRSIDGGLNWHDVSEPEGPASFGFAISVDPDDAETAWVVPAESDMVRAAVDRKLCVCRTNDGGQSWQAFRQGLPQSNCYDFAFRHGLDQRGDQVAFGTACGGLYVSEDRGETWEAIGNNFPPVHSLIWL